MRPDQRIENLRASKARLIDEIAKLSRKASALPIGLESESPTLKIDEEFYEIAGSNFENLEDISEQINKLEEDNRRLRAIYLRVYLQNEKARVLMIDPEYYSENSQENLPNDSKKLALIQNAKALAQSIREGNPAEIYTEDNISRLDQGELKGNFVHEFSRYSYKQFTDGKVPTSFHAVAKDLADKHNISLPQAYFATALVAQRGSTKGKEEASDSQNPEVASPFQRGFLFSLGSEVCNTLALQLADKVELPSYPEKKRRSRAEFYANFSNHQVFEVKKEGESSCSVSFIASGTITFPSESGFISVAKFQIFKRIVIDQNLNVSYAPDLIRFTDENPAFVEALKQSQKSDNSGLLAAGSIGDHPNILVSTPTGKSASEFALPEFFMEAHEKLKRAEIFEQLYQINGENGKEEIDHLDSLTEPQLTQILVSKRKELLEHKKSELQDLINAKSEEDPLAEKKEVLKKFAKFFISDESSVEQLLDNIALAEAFIAALKSEAEEDFSKKEKICSARLGVKEKDYKDKVDRASLYQELTAFDTGASLPEVQQLKKQYLSFCEPKETSNLVIQTMLDQIKALAALPSTKDGIDRALKAFESTSKIIIPGLNKNTAQVEKLSEEILKYFHSKKRRLIEEEYGAATKALSATLENLEKNPDKTDVRFASVPDAKKMIDEGKELVKMPAILDSTVEKMTEQVRALNTYLNSDGNNIIHNFETYRLSTEAVIQAASESDQKSRLGIVEGRFWRYLGIGLTVLAAAAVGLGALLTFASVITFGASATVGIPLMAGGVLLGMTGLGMVNNNIENGWKSANNNIHGLYTKFLPKDTQEKVQTDFARLAGVKATH